MAAQLVARTCGEVLTARRRAAPHPDLGDVEHPTQRPQLCPGLRAGPDHPDPASVDRPEQTRGRPADGSGAQRPEPGADRDGQDLTGDGIVRDDDLVTDRRGDGVVDAVPVPPWPTAGGDGSVVVTAGARGGLVSSSQPWRRRASSIHPTTSLGTRSSRSSSVRRAGIRRLDVVEGARCQSSSRSAILREMSPRVASSSRVRWSRKRSRTEVTCVGAAS